MKNEKIEKIIDLFLEYEEKLPPCFTNKEFEKKLVEIIDAEYQDN